MSDRSRTVIVTGADDGYAPMALELIRSIRDFPEGQSLCVGVIGFGCREPVAARLRAEADFYVSGQWDIALSERRTRGRDWLMGRIAKLFINKYFPGFGTYVWIDSDAWVCDWSAIRWLLAGASRGALAAVPDDWQPERIGGTLKLAHRWLPPRFRTTTFKHARRAGLRTEELRRLFTVKEYNSGVFALRGNAPHWEAIQKNMERLLSGRGRVFGSNQLALTMAVHLDGLPAEPLPMEVNFTGEPMVCARTGRLVSPYLPHRPIGIMHLAARDAQRRDPLHLDTLRDTAGGTVRRSLRYRAEDTAAAVYAAATTDVAEKRILESAHAR